MPAICPKCDRPVPKVSIVPLHATSGPGQDTWKGVAYTCPHCSVILSIQIDPIAIRTDSNNYVSKKIEESQTELERQITKAKASLSQEIAALARVVQKIAK